MTKDEAGDTGPGLNNNERSDHVIRRNDQKP